MPRLKRIASLLALTVLLAGAVASTGLVAQTTNFQPTVGQPGKDVVWVPTPDQLVERMLTMAQVTPNDFVVDLGSGDGRTVIAAAKRFGATAMGVEFNPDMVALSNRNLQAAGVAVDKARFVRGDIFETDISKATVVTMYLLPGLNMRLRPQLLKMPPGTRLVSHQFTMEDWQADETSYLDFRPAYLWIVPAQIHGGWQMTLADGARVNLDVDQTFQKIRGAVGFGPVRAGLREPTLRGDIISFSLIDQKGQQHDFVGKIVGDKMDGTVRSGGSNGNWSAARRAS